MKLILVAHGLGDFLDGIVGVMEKLRGLFHPIEEKEVLRTLAGVGVETLTEITAA